MVTHVSGQRSDVCQINAVTFMFHLLNGNTNDVESHFVEFCFVPR